MNPNGNASQLRQIAKKITLFDNSLDVWFLPYRPNIQGIIFNQLAAALPDEYKDSYVIFAILYSTIIDIEIVDSDMMEASTFDAYWKMRGNIPIDNYHLFEQLLTTPMIDELWLAYEDTRAKLPEAPKETQESKPPDGNPLEQSGLPAKKAKRGRKRTKVTS